MRPLQPQSKSNKAILSTLRRYTSSSRANITEGRQCIKDVYISLNKIELYLEKYNIPLKNHLDNHISNNDTTIDMNGKKTIDHMNCKNSAVDGNSTHIS
jgi:hypothetical protein